MCYGLSGIPVVSLLAVVTVPSGREVSTLEAHATAHPSGQLVQLHVEPASFRVLVAVTGCNHMEISLLLSLLLLLLLL